MADTGVRITVYGGAAGGDAATGEIGGNKILVETGERAWFLDFGMGFGRAGRFFDDFLQPRAAGLRDYLRMGLLPPLEGVYRDDLAAHEPDLWGRYRSHPLYRRLDHVDGVLLSHAHQDHNGYLGFLKPEVPVFTGLMTELIGKAMQDLGSPLEVSYVAPREVTNQGGSARCPASGWAGRTRSARRTNGCCRHSKAYAHSSGATLEAGRGSSRPQRKWRISRPKASSSGGWTTRSPAPVRLPSEPR